MSDWEQRTADAWQSIDTMAPEEFRAVIDKLADELPAGAAIADFERACAWDSTGHSDRAVPLYERALATGLTGIRRRRAVIQMSSSLRNIGQVARSVELLTEEMAVGSDELDDALRAVLSLCLADVGRAREGVSLAVGALAKHLPRYQRSMAEYARLLVEPE